MSQNFQSNPFDSPLTAIVLTSSINPDLAFNILNRNSECQFQRLELEESAFEIFPVGAIVVRDTKDITTFIQNNNIDYALMYMVDGSMVRLSITSTTYVNNAASETEENFVSINVTNSFYKLSQKTSASDLLTSNGKLEDRVDSLQNILNYFDANVYKKLGFGSSQTNTFIGESTTRFPTNYFCLKMLSPGNNNLTYAVTDNAFQYLNYISSLAVGPQTSNGGREPRYLFWSEFGDHINFKYFYENKLDDLQTYNKYNNTRYNYRYSVYDSDVPAQTSTNGNVYKKIYNLRTDPTNQWVSKNYFYVRKTPKFLDSIPSYLTTTQEKQNYTTKALTYHFQDDGEKYNIEVIASSGVVNGVTSGADEMIYEKDWGWVSDHNTTNDHAPATHGSGEFGFAKSYAQVNYMGNSGYFSRSDNIEMWKNIFDITEIHPNYPNPITIPAVNVYTYNVIQTNLSKLYKGNSYTTENLEIRRKIERENFVLYSLCCMGDGEESFFANLIRYEPDPYTSIPLIGGQGLKWRYKWEGLKFTNAAGSTYWTAMELWESDPTNMATGTGPDDTWAINLNERTAGLGSPEYYPPGWVSTGLGSGFKYRPIGCNTATPTSTGDTIAHIVKMYRTSAERLAVDGGISVPEELRGKALYYFSAENVVDGSC